MADFLYVEEDGENSFWLNTDAIQYVNEVYQAGELVSLMVVYSDKLCMPIKNKDAMETVLDYIGQ